jgi:putative tricarboxylic transport membrane protein
MAKKGRAGAALSIAAIGSFVAGTVGVAFIMCLAPLLAKIAIKFGPPEYFCIAPLGLLLLTRLTGKDVIKSYIMMFALCWLRLGLTQPAGRRGLPLETRLY